MSDSFDLEAPDHFTAGTVGPVGQRIFYLQARQRGRLVTLKCEKGQIKALGEYLQRLLGPLQPAPDDIASDVELLEPVSPAWDIGSLGVGYDEEKNRIVVVANEAVEEEEGGEPASARFHIGRGQAAAFAKRARELVESGRPPCPLCNLPLDPSGHVCPRTNGHVVHD
jgi:uncharacterized repeat protein (TIGR03847 family)